MTGPRLVVDAAEIPDRPAPSVGVDGDKIAAGVELLLQGIGEDASRQGLRETPARVAESFRDLFSGYGFDPVSILEPLPGERGEGLIMVRNIAVSSICEHHLLPFVGTAAVAYLPGQDGLITGLSKLARVVEVLARRLQVQERLVREVGDAIERALRPAGVYVLVEAEQMCMTIRGARNAGSVTVTTDARGVFADDAAARTELLALARGD